jgi:hypothetical protein
MVEKETARKIWNCYVEIENSEKLLLEMQEAMKNRENPNPRNAFGDRHCLQLGVPMEREGHHRLFNLRPELAVSIIKAHIENMKSILAEANEQARIELL